MEWRVISLATYDAAMNMAIDHMLVKQVQLSRTPVIRFYKWLHGGVSVGYAQNASIVNTEACDQAHVPYVRRYTGGNVVYHHPEDFTYAVIAPASIFVQGAEKHRVNRTAYETICSWIIKALQDYGLEARLYGSNDVLVGDTKVAGNAQRPGKDIMLQHGSIFYKASPEEWSKYINAPLEKLQKIRGIVELAHKDEPERFYRCLHAAFTANDTVGRVEFLPLSKSELKQAEGLAAKFYTKHFFTGAGTEKMGDACVVDIRDD